MNAAISENSKSKQLFEIYLHEYDNLKMAIVRRIGFRDNLLYVTITTVGAIISYAASNPAHYYALLIVPWICFILGWTYLVNDHMVSDMGRCIREKLHKNIIKLLEGSSFKLTKESFNILKEEIPEDVLNRLKPLENREFDNEGDFLKAVNQYITEEQADNIKAILKRISEHLEQSLKESIFNWEIYHRSDKKRPGRKIVQFMVDELTFCFSGLLVIGAFWMLTPVMAEHVRLLAIGEFVLLILLGIEIFMYADFKKDNAQRDE